MVLNAKDIMKRLREEAKAKKTLSSSASGTSSRSEPAPIQIPAPSSTTKQLEPLSSSPPSSSSSNTLWLEKSLFERKVVIEVGIGTNQGTILRLLEDPMGALAGGNGATLWDSSLALTRFLTEHYSNHGYPYLADKSVLELGAGLGLVGMAMGVMGAQVVATERELALPLLIKNVDHNQGVTGGRVKVTELSWGEDTTKVLLAERDRTGQPLFDIVMGSDLVFPSNADAYPLLADTLSVLLQKSQAGDKALELWQSHESRRPEVEAQFWNMLEDRGIRVHRLTVTDGLPSSHPEDLMILRLSLRDAESEALPINS